ncbi:MAG: hypothetical protein JSW23_03575 [Planctomycetota bacterium]|nr:MAG: hypothetical protein JSW23_03575 [Planctomycetota bacterium]
MKEITDKMAKKALWNVRWIRRLKPLFVVMGLVMWVLAGLYGHFIYRYVQDPWPYESTAETAFWVCFWTVKVAFLLFMGTWMLCMGFMKNYKDILLEYVVEETLKKKEKEEKE